MLMSMPTMISMRPMPRCRDAGAPMCTLALRAFPPSGPIRARDGPARSYVLSDLRGDQHLMPRRSRPAAARTPSRRRCGFASTGRAARGRRSAHWRRTPTASSLATTVLPRRELRTAGAELRIEVGRRRRPHVADERRSRDWRLRRDSGRRWSRGSTPRRLRSRPSTPNEKMRMATIASSSALPRCARRDRCRTRCHVSARTAAEAHCAPSGGSERGAWGPTSAALASGGISSRSAGSGSHSLMPCTSST